jgi:hypothetical protein
MDEELGDEQWDLIAPLLPKPKRRDRPRAEDRRTLSGILWVLRSGAHWKDLPPAAPRMARPGSLGRHSAKILSTLETQAKLNWRQALLDGSFVPAKRGRGYRLRLEGQGQHSTPSGRR